MDVDGDGQLTGIEVISTEYICNGSDGTDGADGTNGTDGTDGTDGTNGTDGDDGLTSYVFQTAFCCNGCFNE